MESLESLFKLSNLIVELYNDFLFNDLYRTDLRRRENMLKQIKHLVFKEYNLIRLLPSSEVEKYYSGEYELSTEYQSIVFDRVNSKMMNLTDDYDGYIFNGFELGIEDIPALMHLSVFDAAMSMLELESYRRFYERLNGLRIDCLQDRLFVDKLKEKLRVFTLESFYMMSTTEIIALVYDADINKMPDIKREVIEKKLGSLNKDSSVKDMDDVIDMYAKAALTRLSLVKRLENNPNAIFNYLVSYIRLEVVIDSYLSKDKLIEFDKYCDSICNNSNRASIGMIKQLIKRKNNHEKK